MKLISIIIPYFKKKKFIQETINSILNQSYKNFEILIVYDDLEKEDLFLLKNISKIDKRIILMINKKNIGAGQSRNKAISKAKGDFLAFIDADDVWHSDKLKLQLAFMIKNKISISHTSYKIIDEKNKKIGFRNAKTISFEQLKKSCDIGLSTVMLKKNILFKNELFGNLKTKEDYVFWLNLARRNFVFFALNKSLTSWRNVRGSLSSSILQKLFDAFRLYKFYLNESTFKAIVSTLILSFNFLRK